MHLQAEKGGLATKIHTKMAGLSSCACYDNRAKTSGFGMVLETEILTGVPIGLDTYAKLRSFPQISINYEQRQRKDKNVFAKNGVIAG